jgi:putative transposase
MDERLRLVGRLLDGESMTVVCREFGISRKTGYKIFDRYKECGLEGLQDRSRRPIRQANRLPFQVERTILQIKREKPSWGAAKIRDRLLRQYPTIETPAKSTVHAVLERNGMVKARRKRRYRAQGTELGDARSPNGLWCTDYKGEFQLGNRRYCYPLTVTAATCSPARRWTRRKRSSRERPLSGSSGSSASLQRSARTTACRSHRRRRCSA